MNEIELKRLPSPEEPADALAAVVALRRTADRLESVALLNAVKQGWSWSQIAAELGVSRQAAHKRHARRVAAALELEQEQEQEDQG